MSEALVLAVEVDGPEVDLMEQMMRAGGYPSMEALVRTALWCHALHLDVDCPLEFFGIRRPDPERAPDDQQPMLWGDDPQEAV